MVFVTRLVQPMSASSGVETANVTIIPENIGTIYYTDENLQYKSQFVVGQTQIIVAKNTIIGGTCGMKSPTGDISIIETYGSSSGGSAVSFLVAQGNGSVTIY